MSTILVVDDHESIRLMFEVALSAGSHRILLAADGQEALDQLDEEPVDLMLLDIMMPRVSGREVLDRLGPDFTTPIVVVTGHEGFGADDLVGFLDQGAVDAIKKPFDMDTFLDLVDALLDGDDAGRQEHRRRRIAELRGHI